MGNALTNPTAKAHARALLWDEESVPDNAWVISIWLESINDLPRGIAGDMKQFADSYVNFKLTKGANGTFGPQPQRSSFRKHSLNPRWGPPEKFMFVVDESTIASGKWPGLLIEVMNYDMVKDKLMAEAYLALSDLGPIKRLKAAAKSATALIEASAAEGAPADSAAEQPSSKTTEKGADSSPAAPTNDGNDDEYLSGGVPISLPIRDAKTGNPFEGCTLNLCVAAAPKKVAFDFKMHTVIEFIRWTPDKGWDPMNRLRGDPRHFALEARNSSNSSTDSSERRRRSSANMMLRRKSSSSMLLSKSASGLPPPAPENDSTPSSRRPSAILPDTDPASNNSGPALADAAPGVSFSADDFNTVAGLLDSGLPHALRQEGAATGIKNNSLGGAGGGGGVQTVQQWAVVAGLGDNNGWQYCATFSPRNTDWYEKPTKFSFCKRRFWRRKLKVIATAAGSTGVVPVVNSGLPMYDGSRPIRVGWLSKRGLHNKAFRTRYFVLWPRALVYYKGEPPNYNMSEFVPAGALNLRGATVKTSDDEEGAITIAVAASERIYTLMKPMASGQQGCNDDISAWLNSLNLTIEGRYAEAANVSNKETPVDARMTIDPTLGLQGLAALVDGDKGTDEESHINQALDTLADADDEDNDEDDIINGNDGNGDCDVIAGNSHSGDGNSGDKNAGSGDGDGGIADASSGDCDSGNGNGGSVNGKDDNIESVGNDNTNISKGTDTDFTKIDSGSIGVDNEHYQKVSDDSNAKFVDDYGTSNGSVKDNDAKSCPSSEPSEELLHHV